MFGKSIFKTYAGIINVFSRVADPLAVVIAALLAYGFRFSFADLDLPRDYRVLITFSFLLVVLIFPMFNLYASWRGQSLYKQANAIFMAWSTVILLMIVILFGLKISSEYSRLWLVSWATLGLVLILCVRAGVYGFLQHQRRKGKNVRYIVIIGAGDLCVRALNKIKEAPWMGFKVKALFDDNPELIGKEVDGHLVVGHIFDVDSYVASEQVDELWIALPLRAEERVKQLLYELRHRTLNIKFIPDIFGFSLLNHSMGDIDGLPVVNLSDTPMGGMNLFLKSVEDRLFALVILVVISPLLVLIAISIKVTSPGPVIFKQNRHGWDGRVIKVYKFRSMKMHDELKGQVSQATKNDDRVTRVGAFLRRTSLDELPQFFNVLQGKMSIVGPRPHAIEHNELYKDQVDKYMLRHMVKPGVTGWAQINGFRGETDTLDKMKKRVEYDLYYIENWSIWLDIKIILLTIIKGFINKNAY